MCNMRFASIASGSSGNCLYVGNDDTHILIDTGVSKKRIESGLKSLGVEPGDISAVLITHEHSDHVKGLGVFSRKYHVPIFATKGTLREICAMNSLGDIDSSLFRVIRGDEGFAFQGMNIQPLSVPHDAIDPVCYKVSSGKKSIATVTDLGYFDGHIVEHVKGCDALYVEANHDLHMLETGPYPYRLKLRISGNYGHLCNEMSGQLIGRAWEENMTNVILGHLSQENNYPKLALEAVKAELSRDYPELSESLDISVAPREIVSDLIKI